MSRSAVIQSHDTQPHSPHHSMALIYMSCISTFQISTSCPLVVSTTPWCPQNAIAHHPLPTVPYWYVATQTSHVSQPSLCSSCLFYLTTDSFVSIPSPAYALQPPPFFSTIPWKSWHNLSHKNSSARLHLPPQLNRHSTMQSEVLDLWL